jgi:hypothetical protein
MTTNYRFACLGLDRTQRQKSVGTDPQKSSEDLAVRLARGALWPVGRGPHGRENEGVRVGAAGLVAEVEFVEWTPDSHLRHSRFVRFCD